MVLSRGARLAELVILMAMLRDTDPEAWERFLAEIRSEIRPVDKRSTK